MFAVFCPRHGSRVLLSPSSMLALVATSSGIRIRYQCTCGHRGLSGPPRLRVIDDSMG